MIFPYLKGILFPLRAPATYLILLLNIIIFCACLKSFNFAQNEIEEILSDRSLLKTQGLIFSQFVESRPKKFQPLLVNVAQKSLDGDYRSSYQMGGLAIRNTDFMTDGAEFKPSGDEVLIQSWRTEFKKILEQQKNHPSYYLGLSYQHHSWINWFSYQFSHSGFAHLFWNMIFLLLLGCFVESEVGSAVFVFTYLSAGLFGALTFSMWSGVSAIPLVGASAAISGLVGFIIVQQRSKKLQFFFWLLPVQKYFGFTQLPAWFLFVIFCLPDLAGQLSSVSEFGSIAYSAHLGGALFGAILAAARYLLPFSEAVSRIQYLKR